MGKCKSCVKSGVRENRQNRKQQYAEYDRARANLPHRIEARRNYRADSDDFAGNQDLLQQFAKWLILMRTRL